MNEEQVTKSILKCLIENGWDILCFDFPQSGTGRLLHPDNQPNAKNLLSINPDIVTIKKDICLFFENKDRFFKSDFIKVNGLIQNNNYTKDISKLLDGYDIKKIYYGIGMPLRKYTTSAKKYQNMVDFIVGVTDEYVIKFCFNKYNIKL